MITRLLTPLISKLDATIFNESSPRPSALQIIWLAGLYAFGIFLWGKIFEWSNANLDFFDWAHINIPRLSFVRDSILAGVLPLHMSDTASLHDVTNRFLTLPDVITTPQMLVMKFLSVPQYIFLDVLLHYTISFLGLLWFYKKFNLSIYTFSFLFFIFGFNGYIIAHYSVGHFTWAAYFLFPLFFALVIQLIDEQQSWKWVFKFSLLLFYMILAGSQHHYVWLVLFLFFLAIPLWKKIPWLIAVVIFSGFLSAIRLLPPALELTTFTTKGNFLAVFGYPSFAHLLHAMLFIQVPLDSPVSYHSINLFAENFWDFNFYIGLIGTAFILFFGIYTWLKQREIPLKSLAFPAFMVLALGIDSTYWLFRLTGIPLFASERAIMRIVAVPLVCFMLMGAMSFQHWWKKTNPNGTHKLIALALLGYVIIDLWAHIKIWRPREITQYFAPISLNLPENSIANVHDPTYFNVLLVGLLITLLSATILTSLSLYEQKRKKNAKRPKPR
jgi:hypothetical protein